MHAPRAEVAGGHECLGTELVLKIKGPMLHIGSLKIRVDSIHVRNCKTYRWIAGKWIIEGSGIDGCLRLERRIGADDSLPGIKRELIIIEAVSNSDRGRAFLERVPGDSYTWCEVVASRRDGLAKRRDGRTGNRRLAVNHDPVQRVTRSSYPRAGTAENLKGLAGIEKRRIEVCQAAVNFPRLAITRETHSIVQRDVAPGSPLVLSECLKVGRYQVSSQIKLTLGERLKITQEEIRPKLIGIACC